MDLSKLNVSNGSGEAVRALVTVLRSPGSTVITPNSLVKWPNDFAATTGPLLADGTLDPAKTIVFRGHIAGSTIVIDELAPGYTDTFGSAVGDVVVIKPNTFAQDTLINMFKVAHNDDGTLKAVTSNPGWTDLTGVNITSVTHNGQRSYDLAVSTDLRTVLSPGMRLRTTRTAAAPTQSTSLNGTTQYYSKTTPAGMTFTDDFVVSAWVKLSSYASANMTVMSRYNGTSGWYLEVLTDGRFRLVGANAAAANYSFVQSYQSLPLNKWVHITAQLDMSAFTATTTTSYLMLDGVDVPASVSRGGTNPTALIQAGNLEVGSSNAGTLPFPGKIAQAAVFSAKVTQATIRSYISQGLLGTETSLISAYSFNNSINDLNTTNANNLTANGGAVATNADSPFGGNAMGTISSTLDYGIVQKVTASTLTVQVAEGNTIPTSGGVASASYSTYKSPYGFPSEQGKWRIASYFRVEAFSSTPTSNVWYVPTGGLWRLSDLPIGNYKLGYSVNARAATGVTNTFVINYAALSTSSSTPSETELIATGSMDSASGQLSIENRFTRELFVPITVQTTYYLIHKVQATTMGATNGWRADPSSGATAVIYADNSLL